MPLATPLNNFSSTLAVDHTAGSGTLVLAGGAGAAIAAALSAIGAPSVSPSTPIKVTVARRSTLVNGLIGPSTTRTIFTVTGVSGDTLTGCTAAEGTTDAAYSRNDPVGSLTTAGEIYGLQTTIAATDAAAIKTTTDQEKVGQLALKAPDDSTAPLVVKDADDNTLHDVATDGRQTVSCNSSEGDVFHLHNLFATAGFAATTYPFRMRVTGIPSVIDGTVDHTFQYGWDVDLGTASGMVWGHEHHWLNPGTLATQDEWYIQRQPRDGSAPWRPFYFYAQDNNERAIWQGLGYTYTWAGRTKPGTPLLSVFTNDDDKGGVTIRNTGGSPPLGVFTTDQDIVFSANSDQNVLALTAQTADAINTSRNGVAFSSVGSYYAGGAAHVAESSFKTVISDPTTGVFRAQLQAGNAVLGFNSLGRLAVSVDASLMALVTQNIVMPLGYLAAINVAGNATKRLIGLAGTAGSEKVTIDPDKMGVTISSALGGAAGSTARGALDVASALYLGDPGVAHGIVNSYDGMYFNADADANNSDGTIEFGKKRSGAGGSGTTYLSMSTAATFGIPVVLPQIADAAAPNGSIFWSTTTPNALKVKDPAGNIKTVTLA